MKRYREWWSEKLPNDPRQLQRIHGWLTVLWFVMMPLAIATGWLASVVFISIVSIYANFVGHFSSWQAARAETVQFESDMEDDVKKIKDKVHE